MIEHNRILAFVFALLAFPACLAINAALPPIQAPDEIVHYAYARTISLGHMLPERKDGAVNAKIDSNDIKFIQSFYPITFSGALKYTSDQLIEYPVVAGSEDEIDITSAAVYAPFAYWASAAAMSITDIFGWGPFERFYAGRAANSLLYVALGSLAILACPAYASLLLVILLFPMSLHQAASFSPEAFYFSATALAISLFLRHFANGRQPSLRDLIAPTLLTGFVVLTRSTMIFLALLPLTLSLGTKSKNGLVSATVICAMMAAWVFGFAPTEEYAMRKVAGVSIENQISFLLENPLNVLWIASATIQQQGAAYVPAIIGRFEENNVFNSALVHYLNYFMVAFGVVLTIISPSTVRRSVRLGLISAGILIIGSTFGAMYLSWTPVRSWEVVGVQGRYFIPALLCFAFAIGGLCAVSFGKRIMASFVIATAAVHSLSISSLLLSLIFRFWFR